MGDSGERDPEVYTAVARRHPQQVQGVLRGSASAAQMAAVAADLEADAAAIRAGELGGDADRMTKLAGVLRELAMRLHRHHLGAVKFSAGVSDDEEFMEKLRKIDNLIKFGVSNGTCNIE